MSAPKIFGKPKTAILEDVGYALQQVKRARGLSPDDMRIVLGLKDADMISKYITGEHEMKMISWLRANEAWPELADLIVESDNERALKGRQRPLDFENTPRRSAA
jgi:hypothetical protein